MQVVPEAAELFVIIITGNKRFFLLQSKAKCWEMCMLTLSSAEQQFHMIEGTWVKMHLVPRYTYS